MTTLNYYRAGGVEKHSDSSFTLFGYIENKKTGEDGEYQKDYGE